MVSVSLVTVSRHRLWLLSPEFVMGVYHGIRISSHHVLGKKEDV